MGKFQDEDEAKNDNLMKEKKAGLKSLKKRIKEGFVVVCSTDKSSRFAGMSLEEYEEVGKKHADKDQEVDKDMDMVIGQGH